MTAKAYPEQRVGVFALRDDKLEVIEYLELDPQQAIAVNPGGHLLCLQLDLQRVIHNAHTRD